MNSSPCLQPKWCRQSRTAVGCAVSAALVALTFVASATAAGKTWKPVGLSGGGGMFAPAISPADPNLLMLNCDMGAAYLSDDGGDTWLERTQGLPWKEIQAFTGGSDPATGLAMLYSAIQSKEVKGAFQGGIYRSRDRGESWQWAMGSGLNTDTTPADPWAHGAIAQYQHLLTTDAQPLTVYALNTSTGFHPPHSDTVYRSDDGGDTWRWWNQNTWAPWRNTCYELAFEPDIPGTLWGAFSDVHDIPNDNIISERHGHRGLGGVCVSRDFGAISAGKPMGSCATSRRPQPSAQRRAVSFGA